MGVGSLFWWHVGKKEIRFFFCRTGSSSVCVCERVVLCLQPAEGTFYERWFLLCCSQSQSSTRLLANTPICFVLKHIHTHLTLFSSRLHTHTPNCCLAPKSLSPSSESHTVFRMHTHKDTEASVNLRGRGSIPVILQPTCLPYRHAADTATRLPARLGLIKHGTAQGSNGMTHTCRQTHGYTVLQTCANPSSLKFLIKYLPKIWPQREKLFLASSIIINSACNIL